MPSNALMIYSYDLPIEVKVGGPDKESGNCMMVVTVGDIEINMFRKLDTLLDFGYAIIKECRKLQPASDVPREGEMIVEAAKEDGAMPGLPMSPTQIADEAIGLFLELRDQHSAEDEDQIRARAVNEVADGVHFGGVTVKAEQHETGNLFG